MANNTWSGLTLEQDQIWEQLWNEHVPTSGTASTVGGEILRAMSRIIYRFYNDGDMVGVGYGNETCNSSDRYLTDVVPEYKSLDDGYTEYSETAYEKHMLKNHRIVFAYLQENPQLFKEENTTDSREACQDDYDRARYQDDEPECDYGWEDDEFFEGEEEEDDGERYSLIGVDGNAFAIMGYVIRAMRETGFSQDEIKAYREDAESDDYNHLLCVSADMIDKCNERC